MRTVIQTVLILLLVLPLSLAQPASAQTPAPPTEPDSGSVVCAPGVYLAQPSDCVPLGPSVYLTNLARAGLLAGSPTPLPATKPDSALAALPFHYFHVITEKPVPIVASPGDTSGIQLLYKGFVYL